MSPANPLLSRRRRVVAAALWLAGVLLAIGVTRECLFGQAERRLTADQILGERVVGAVVLPPPSRLWSEEPHLEVLEDGEPLTDAAAPELEIVAGSSGRPGYMVVRFRASDGTAPKHNGRRYVVRHPRWRLPGALALVALCWITVVVSTVRLVRGGRDEVADRRHLGIAGWSFLGVGFVYTLFALQAWIPAPSTLWLITVAAVALPGFLRSLSSHRWWAPAGWMPWYAALVTWSGGSILVGGGSQASTQVLAGLVALSAWGVLLYLGLRRSLHRLGQSFPWLTTALVTFVCGASLARDAGFDPAGHLAALGMSAIWSGGMVNPWTTKFIGHWLVVIAWLGAASFGLRSWRESRSQLLWIALLVAVALGVNGSKSAILAIAVSVPTALVALRWPTLTRRLVMVVLVTVVVLAPLWSALPWWAHRTQGDGIVADWSGVLETDVRGGTWEFARRAIAERPLAGWGLGGSAALPGGDLPMAEALGLDPATVDPLFLRRPIMIGGHPHNAALLIWLDLGLIGAVLTAGLLVAIGRGLAAAEGAIRVHASLLALLTATAAILMFNYPVWETEVLSLLWMTAAVGSSVLPAQGRGLAPSPEPH